MYIYIYIYKYKYIISIPENNDSTKLVISLCAGGKPPAGRNTDFVYIYIYISLYIYIHIYIYIYGSFSFVGSIRKMS